MKKLLSLILLLFISSLLSYSQVVQPLKKKTPMRRKMDVGLRIGYFPAHKGTYDRLFYDDPYGNTRYITLRPTTLQVDVPLNLTWDAFYVLTGLGVKWIGYTPRSVETISSYAERVLDYPYSFVNGYLSSFWGTYSLSVGLKNILLVDLGLGISLDCFLAASKISNPDNLFISIGRNSYSSVVPTFFIETGFDTARFRINARAGFQARGYLDGERLYRTTGQLQRSFDTGPEISLGLLLTYKLYSSYGKYRVYN